MEIVCKAIIFDLDGILVNSNPIAERHWKVWAEANGISLEDILAIHHGRPTAQTIAEVAPHLDAASEAARKEKIEADDLDGLSRYPGTGALIDKLPDSQWALATSGTRRTARKRLGAVNFAEPAILVTADDVTRGKPDPAPYLLAARGLGIPIEDCIVIEDAPAGIRSAKTAGARVIAITSTNASDALSEADFILSDLRDIAVNLHENQELSLAWTSGEGQI